MGVGFELVRYLIDVARQEEIVSKATAAASRLEHLELSLSQFDTQLATMETLLSGREDELRSLAAEWQALKDEKARLAVPGKGEDGPRLVESLSASLEASRRELVEMSVEYGNLQGHGEDLERRMSERETLLDAEAHHREGAGHPQLVGQGFRKSRRAGHHHGERHRGPA